MQALTTIACAVDGSAATDAAVHYAARLAREVGAELQLVHVDPAHRDEAVLAPPAAVAEKHECDVGHWAAIAGDLTGKPVHVQLESGDVAESLVEYARRSHCSAMVLGTLAHSRLAYAVGSVVGKVLQRAPCPVIVVPAPVADVATDFPGQVA